MYVERQIYIRSHGHVQFISLSPLTQTCFAAIAFAFFGWIAFASVNVVFKEQIIASKDRRYVKMQGAYEERMAQLQSAYDELNGQLVITEERFLATTMQLEDKHRQLAALMSQRQTASSQLDTMRRRYAATAGGKPAGERGNKVLMRVERQSEGPALADTTTGPRRLAGNDRFIIDSAENAGGTVDLAGLAELTALAGLAGDNAQNGTVAQIDTRLAQIDRAQQTLINNIEEVTDRRVRELKSIIGMTKVIDPETLIERRSRPAARRRAAFISLADHEALAGGEGDSGFGKQLQGQPKSEDNGRS